MEPQARANPAVIEWVKLGLSVIGFVMLLMQLGSWTGSTLTQIAQAVKAVEAVANEIEAVKREQTVQTRRVEKLRTRLYLLEYKVFGTNLPPDLDPD